MNKHLIYFWECFADISAERDLDIKRISADTGIAKSRLYAFRNGKQLPSLDNALKLSEYFGCSLDYLFGFTEVCSPPAACYSAPVSERVKTAMDASSLTRYKIFRFTDISQAQLYRWYHGIQVPALSSLVVLADCMECSVDYLAGADTDTPYTLYRKTLDNRDEL